MDNKSMKINLKKVFILFLSVYIIDSVANGEESLSFKAVAADNSVKIIFQNNNSLDRQGVIRIYRREVDFVFGKNKKDYFNSVDPSSDKDLIYETKDSQFNQYIDKDVAIGKTYVYWVSAGESVSKPYPVKVRDLDVWWSYDVVLKEIFELEKDHKDIVEVSVIGKTIEGKDILGVKVGGSDKKIALVGAVHAGESGPELIIPFLKYMLNEQKHMFNKISILAVPCVNADQRQEQINGVPWYLRRNTRSVDLNRNFPGDWEQISYKYGSNTAEPNSGTYRGTEPMSEPETKAVVSFLRTNKPQILFSFHHVASLTGKRFWAPAAASKNESYREKCETIFDLYSEGYSRRNPKDHYPKGLVYSATSGSLPTWCYREFGIPAFELERHDSENSESDLAKSNFDKTDLQMLMRNQQQHREALLNVITHLFLKQDATDEDNKHKHNESEFSKSQAQRVLEMLDLNKPGLEKVKQSYEKQDIERSCTELLKYYRSRTNIKHPELNRMKKNSTNKPSETDIKWATDAMNHIFVGQQKYPSSFRGWDIDWKTNPVEDREWIFQLHRMYFWDSMGKMYWYSKDENYANEWVYQFSDWYIKSSGDTENLNIWRPLEVGLRLNRFVNLFEYFIDSPAFTPAVLVSYLENIHKHNQYLLSRYSQKHNHAVMEARGGLFSSIYFPELKESAVWRTKAIDVLNREIEIQVYADGVQCELSPHYHQVSIDNFLDSYLIAQKNGFAKEFPKIYVDTLQKMMEVTYKILLPDFTIPQFGDSWKESVQSNFVRWNKMFPREDFLYFSAEGSKGKHPEQKCFALSNGGFYSIRSGWSEQDTCMILKCGPKAGGHAQPDNGTFELFALGHHFMPDSGCYTYIEDDDRKWFRRSSSHQTLTLNNENIDCKPELLMWDTLDNLDTLIVQNQSYPNLTHRRAVFYVNKSFFVLVDRAKGAAQGDISIHFQFKEGKSVIDTKNLFARTDFDDGKNLLVKTQSQKGIRLRAEQGWVSYVYTKRQERPAFSFMINKNGKLSHVDFVTLLVPFVSELPDCSIENVNCNENEITFKIKLNNNIFDVKCNLADKKSSLEIL